MNEELLDRLTAEVRSQLPEGFSVNPRAHTGGNCWAMIVTAPDKRTVYITNADADLPFYHEGDADLALGYYDAQDEEDGYLTMLGEEVNDLYWENVRTWLKSWVEGHPYRDLESAEAVHARQTTNGDHA